MSDISFNIKQFQSTLPSTVKLVAVSKTKPESEIREAYNAGQRIFGENKVQELLAKYESLPKDIEWHFIGHLQTNKVKFIAPFISMIHSVDSLKLLMEIDKEAQKNNRKISCLFEMHIAQEDTKFGLDYSEISEIIENPDFKSLNNIQISGVMGMATYTDDVLQIRNEFHSLVENFNKIKTKYFINDPLFKEISMGMSGDYTIAIEEGSTLIRVGSLIFGERIYL